MRVMINGFGRIGRSVLRAWLEGGWPDLQIVAINDIAAPDVCAYLLEYDSVFGPLNLPVSTPPGQLVVGPHVFSLTREGDISTMALGDIDLVMECTGLTESRGVVMRGITAGARRVLVSGPSRVADVTVVLGANDHVLGAEHRVISNASCTTNALAPLVRVLDQAFGIQTGRMVTIHCYTGSQPTVDAPRGADLARGRAAALSMVPTTTSAGRLLDLVLPDLAGRVECSAVRVPTASVSAVDLCVMTTQPATPDAVNERLSSAGGVIGWTDRPLVSSDLRKRSESIVMALPETSVTAGGMLRVFGWYDNEWGFSCRMLDMARRLQALPG